MHYVRKQVNVLDASADNTVPLAPPLVWIVRQENGALRILHIVVAVKLEHILQRTDRRVAWWLRLDIILLLIAPCKYNVLLVKRATQMQALVPLAIFPQ